MLYKLSIKNIKKSFKDYCIYFFTLVLGVSIFYIFNSLESQTIMMKVSSNTKELIKVMNNILEAVSVFVSFILGFLIIYASNFLIKRRNKEFAIYLTLGMSKRKISWILFIETLLIGIISLFIGLSVGVVLSQFTSLLVANMFEADLTDFTFIFSKSAAVKTLIYFSIIYIIVMIFNTIVISKCKLINLIQSRKKSEQVKIKNNFICTLIFILSICILGYSYYLVTIGIDKLTEGYMIFKPIILGIIGTFLLFWSMSGLLLKIFTIKRKTYYKGLNSFILRQLSSKINTTVISMTIICLMLFVTICVFSSALSLKNSMTTNLKSLVPVDIEFIKYYDEYNETGIIEDSKISIKETLNKMDFNIEKYLIDIIDFNTYRTNNITVKDTLGNYYKTASKIYPLLQYNEEETFIKISDYNKIARLFNLEELTIEKDEYILISDFDSWSKIRDESLKIDTKINILGKTYSPKYKEHKKGFIYISSNHINSGIFVVPDDALNETLRDKNIIIANYKEKTKSGKQKIENKINNLITHPYKDNTYLKIDTKIEIYEGSIGLGAMATFIGLYLGIIFLISSAAILALKELSESSDNKERYKTLRRLGADEKLINKAIFKQIAIFFTFPLIIALIHSIFGIIFCNYILETFGNEKLLMSIIMTATFLILIYGSYFLMTYMMSKNIIKE